MKIIGLTNPLLVVLGLFPLYLFYSFINHMGQDLLTNEIESYFLFLFILLLFVVGPIFLLMSLRLIIIEDDTIKVLYIFRLKTKTFFIKELKSVYTQKMIGNGAFPFDFYQTYLYFGQERRIRFSAIEFINYRALKEGTENIENASGR